MKPGKSTLSLMTGYSLQEAELTGSVDGLELEADRAKEELFLHA